MATWQTVLEIARALPEVEPSTSYGTAAIKVKKKLILRMKEDGASLAVHVADLDTKEAMIATRPDVFFTTPHYDGHAMVLARLGELSRAELADLVEEAYRAVAPVTCLRALDSTRAAPRKPAAKRARRA